MRLRVNEHLIKTIIFYDSKRLNFNFIVEVLKEFQWSYGFPSEIIWKHFLAEKFS